MGIASDLKDFSPHITTVRVKNIPNKESFLERIKNLKVKNIEFKIDNFSLIKSELMRDGPIYKLIKKFSLK